MNTPFFLNIAEEIKSYLNFKSLKYEAKGAFKETYKIIDNKGEIAALKILDPNKCDIDRKKREINAMLKCNSKFIGKLYSYDNIKAKDGFTYNYIIEEYFDGGTLSDQIENNILPLDLFKKYGLDLIYGLKNLKNNNLVHRDIKPDNIMFKKSNNTPHLVDFGLVRDLSESSLTMSWLPQGPGTPYYSAPEQLNNDKYLIKWRTDQFALGIVFGICLTGQHPFQDLNMTISETVMHIAQRKTCSQEFITKIKKTGYESLLPMLEPWPINRYNSIDDLINIFK